MDIYLTHGSTAVAIAFAAVFTLGWLAHLWLAIRRENALIQELQNTIEDLERKRDSAHRVSLELAATHNKLVGEHMEAEWTIHSLKSDLKVRDERINKLLVTANSERQVVKKSLAPASSPRHAIKTDLWSLEGSHLV